MLKNRIGLSRGAEQQAVLTWHKPDGNGGHIPIAIDFSDSLDEETRQRIASICARPLNVREDGEVKKALPGSSKHFIALPKALERLGFRTRVF